MPADTDTLPAVEDASATDAPSGRQLHLILIDGSGFIFRAFHALPPMTRPDGTPVNAVFGFTNMLAKLLREHVGTHIAVIFDAGRLTFRNRLYDAYKAHRPPPPEELIPQFALIREATAAFCVPSIELADWEADDLIAAYTVAAEDAGGQVTIVSSDKDLMQLIRPGVEMLDPIKQKPIGPAEVMEKFGVTPDKMVEVQALIGELGGQRPGRSRHRPQGCGAAHQRVRRRRERAGGRAGDEAVEAPRHADRARGEGADFARAGEAAGRRTAADAGGKAGGLRAGQAETLRLAARPGVPQRGQPAGPGRRDRRRAADGGSGTPPLAGRLAAARGGPGRTGGRRGRLRTLRDADHGSRAAGVPGRNAGLRLPGAGHRDGRPGPDARPAGRAVAGGGARTGRLCSAAARIARPAATTAGGGGDRGTRSGADGSHHPEDLPSRQVRHAGADAGRLRAAGAV